MEVPVVQNVRKVNDQLAALNRADLKSARTACLNLMGSPGCGKTALLERTLAMLGGEMRIGVLTGDLTTTRDAERLAAHAEHVIQINTGRGCHLDAGQVREGMGSLPVPDLDLLVVENVGNLICPVGYDLGQDEQVGMFSVPEGADKPAKHPYLVLEAALVILNKIDLLPHVPFSLEEFERDLFQLREDVPLLRLATTTGEGIEAWLDWVRALVSRVA